MNKQFMYERLKTLYTLLSHGEKLPEKFMVDVCVSETKREILKVRIFNSFLLQVSEGPKKGFVIDVRDVAVWFPNLNRLTDEG